MLAIFVKLHLHVGHGKTGSSFLQSWLALNRSELWHARRLHYPVAPSDARALSGRFTMGNGVLLDHALQMSNQPDQLTHFWSDLVPRQPDVLPQGFLFSAERWARHLPRQLEDLLRVADAGGFARMTIWLVVRDPLDHALSVYGQMVKRHGFSGTLHDWLEIYDFPKVLLRCLEVFQSRPDRISLRVDHYGRQSNSLQNCLMDWLELPINFSWKKPSTEVNRSLTKDELLLMRWLNKRLGEKAFVVGEQLVDRLPMLKSARLQPSQEAHKRFVDRWSPIVDQINLRIPNLSQLSCQGGVPVQSIEYEHEEKLISLMPEQLDCLLNGLLQEPVR